MRIKIAEADIAGPARIEGLEAFDAVEVLFRRGPDPIARGRFPCPGAALDLTEPMAALRLPAATLEPRTAGPLPTLAVAVCTRGRPDQLLGALRSLGSQELAPDEILVVDNEGSSEVRRLVERVLPSARYLHERSPGLDFARNRALRATRCEIVAFLDDDAEADPGWVRALAEAFAAQPGAAAVTGLILPLELETRAQQRFEERGGFERGFARRVLPGDGERRLGIRLPLASDVLGVGSGCNMAFRTEVLRGLGGFDEALDTGPPLPGGGDLDAFYRVVRSGRELVYEPRALVRHRHRRDDEGLHAQLVGHRRSLSAFLVKTLAAERGRARIGVAALLVWRHGKDAYRLLRGLVGRDALPLRTLAAILAAGFVGLGSHAASRARVRARERRSGGRRPAAAASMVELLRYRELVWHLTSRDLKVKYQRSWLGFLWTLLNPLITAGVLIAVFSIVIRIPLAHYWAFLLSGYFVWSFFAQVLNGGVQSAVGSAYLTRSAYFPQEVVVLSAALARFLEFLAEIAIVLVVLAVFHHQGVPASFVTLLVLVPMLFALVLGFLLPAVILAVYYQDTVPTISLATTALFYATPVFYNLEMVPEPLRPLFLLNPLTWLLDLFQSALYWGRIPEVGVLAAILALSAVVATLGYAVFDRYKRSFAELV